MNPGRDLAAVACIWLSAWFLRRKYEVDYQLDWKGHLIRWLVVASGFYVAAALRGPQYTVHRVTAGVVGLAFLCWPNISYHLSRVLRHSERSDGGER